jgi:general secretion pathway protein L
LAHRIIGVDLGASAIKLARYDAGFRKASLLDVDLVPAAAPAPGAPATPGASATPGAAGASPPFERVVAQMAVLRRHLVGDKALADELYVALPGEHLTFRVIDLPFSDPRRIESVLGYELESQVMTPLDELVIDHVVVGTRGSDTRVLVAAAPRELVRAVVDASTAEKLVVRQLSAAPLVYAAVWGPASRAVPGATLVIDIGHEATTACVLREGTPEFARTISRGGRHFTEAVARGYRLDMEAAERAKLDGGFIAHPGMEPQSPSQARMDTSLREAARSLVRELRQTLAAYRASYGVGVERIWLTGGGARLVGLRELLVAELGVTAEPGPGAGEDAGKLGERADLFAVALGMAQVGLGNPLRLNFRKGEFAYRSDYSFLRARAAYFGGAALAILFFAIVNAAVALHGLRQENEHLVARLRKQTTDLFGTPRGDARAISEELKEGQKSGGPPIPTVTAFDVFDEISRRIPPGDKLKLDVLELDIKPKRTYIKATAETAQQVDDLADALSKIECFTEVQKGKLRSVTAPARPGPDGQTPSGPSELKQFELTITTTCP